MSSDVTFTVDEAIAAQREMRKRLGLGEEKFSLPAFIGMISDEIEKTRATGGSRIGRPDRRRRGWCRCRSCRFAGR